MLAGTPKTSVNGGGDGGAGPDAARRHPWSRDLPRTVGLILVAWLAMLGLLILAGHAVEHSSGIQAWDRKITHFVVEHRTNWLNQVMKTVTATGSWVAALSLTLLVAALAWRRVLPGFTVVAIALAWLSELCAVHLTKAVVHRPRPPEELRLISTHGWSFPSGHTANAVVVFTALAVVLAGLAGSRLAGTLIWALAVLCIALVGFSRIELGVHWTTDVLTSALWTTGWLLILRALLTRAAST